jgi:hypothetical protein
MKGICLADGCAWHIFKPGPDHGMLAASEATHFWSMKSPLVSVMRTRAGK